jgi:hypothetical protein
MRIPDDDQQFEAELKRFIPREVAPLTTGRPARSRWSMAVFAVAAAVLAIIGIVSWNMHGTSGRVISRHTDVPSDVTLGRAQAAVAEAPSPEEAIDRLEQESRAASKPKSHGNQSVLAALGKENL